VLQRLHQREKTCDGLADVLAPGNGIVVAEAQPPVLGERLRESISILPVHRLSIQRSAQAIISVIENNLA
jgi:hypothetical protein